MKNQVIGYSSSLELIKQEKYQQFIAPLSRQQVKDHFEKMRQIQLSNKQPASETKAEQKPKKKKSTSNSPSNFQNSEKILSYSNLRFNQPKPVRIKKARSKERGRRGYSVLLLHPVREAIYSRY